MPSRGQSKSRRREGGASALSFFEAQGHGHQPGRQGIRPLARALGAGAGTGIEKEVAGVECVFLTGGRGHGRGRRVPARPHRSHFDWLVGRGLLQMFLSCFRFLFTYVMATWAQSWPRLHPNRHAPAERRSQSRDCAGEPCRQTRSSASWRRPWCGVSPPRPPARCRSCRQSPHLQCARRRRFGGGGGGHSLGDGHPRCRN